MRVDIDVDVDIVDVVVYSCGFVLVLRLSAN